MKNNAKNIKVKFKDGSQISVEDFIKKQYEFKISNFFTKENIDTIIYALEVQLINDINGEVFRAINKIDALAKFKSKKN